MFLFLHFRARFVLSSNESQAGLRISNLQLADEGLYRCEITYLEINEGCPVVQYVNLTVLGMIKRLGIESIYYTQSQCMRYNTELYIHTYILFLLFGFPPPKLVKESIVSVHRRHLSIM